MTVPTSRSASAAARLCDSSRGRVTSACIPWRGEISVRFRASPPSTSRSDPLGSGIGGPALAPKGGGAVHSIEPLAELSLGLCECLLVPFEHPRAGAGDGPAAGSAAKLGQNVMCDAHVVGGAEIVLQALQMLYELLQIILVEQAPEKLHRIAEFLGGDAQFVALRRRQSPEPFAALAHLAPASIEQARGQLADWRTQQRGRLGRPVAPPARLEPVGEAQH